MRNNEGIRTPQHRKANKNTRMNKLDVCDSFDK